MNNAARRPARQCPKGHHMDPTWTQCPYCEAEEKSKQKSSRPAESGSSADRQTRVGQVPSENQDRKTKQMPAGGSSKPGGHVGKGESRRIVGVMITYSWRPEGELFPVREGKNFIGSGRVSSDASHRDCEILIPIDDRMSSEHALILCRHGRYEIIDQTSSNGTFLNGEMLMSNQSVQMEDQAEIKTGNTLWSFFKIKPPELSKIPSQRPTPLPESDTGTEPDRGGGTIVK